MVIKVLYHQINCAKSSGQQPQQFKRKPIVNMFIDEGTTLLPLDKRGNSHHHNQQQQQCESDLSAIFYPFFHFTNATISLDPNDFYRIRNYMK